MADTPNIEDEHFRAIDADRLGTSSDADHPPRILLLYGSLRERSFSRLMTEEAARVLHRFGAETKTFNPSGLPLPDDAKTDAEFAKVEELHKLVEWSEGMVWCSPERHGAMTGIMKTQIDWIPLSMGAVRPTQGKTLAVMQVNGGSQSFNTVNQLRILGRWMRLLTIPNQSSGVGSCGKPPARTGRGHFLYSAGTIREGARLAKCRWFRTRTKMIIATWLAIAIADRDQ